MRRGSVVRLASQGAVRGRHESHYESVMIRFAQIFGREIYTGAPDRNGKRNPRNPPISEDHLA